MPLLSYLQSLADELLCCHFLNHTSDTHPLLRPEGLLALPVYEKLWELYRSDPEQGQQEASKEIEEQEEALTDAPRSGLLRASLSTAIAVH